MNLEPRIVSIAAALEIEYAAACLDELEPFERMIDRIETAIARYRHIRSQRNHE